ncbi:hypothetical protein BPOR_0282g00080 [Botrytis porri]|uniref:Uncharacterized protein n=1 Tax=Botrytis porri TaxID=87229 RepID=A0A4Z1KQC5_9HELO|nr:hypothetical protein BPOR_0282g00080 [Botrytis porri]
MEHAPNGYGIHFCEYQDDDGPPITRSTLDTFHEILRTFREKASMVLNTLALQSKHEEVGEGVGMEIEFSLRLGDETITAKETCSEASSSCDFHQGEHCCPSLVCYLPRSSSMGECHPPFDSKSEDEEILDVLRKPYLSPKQNLKFNLNSNVDESLESEEEKKEEANKWDFLKVIEMPPRLDDITKLPKCKPMNSPAYEDFECRQAMETQYAKEITASLYKKKNGGELDDSHGVDIDSRIQCIVEDGIVLHLWVLAEKFLIRRLQNYIVHNLCKKATACRQIIPAHYGYAYENTVEGSALRRFVVEQSCWTANIYDEDLNDYPVEMLRDIVTVLKAQLPASVRARKFSQMTAEYYLVEENPTTES